MLHVVAPSLSRRRGGARPRPAGRATAWRRGAATVALAFATGLSATGAMAGTVLYDPAAGLPSAQGWTTASLPTPGSDTLVGGRLRVDTTGITTLVHGHGRTSPWVLDTVAGFTFAFGLQTLTESHDTPNRAGFSVLLQGQDSTQALELGFWTDRVWALAFDPAGPDGGFFDGGGVAFDTASAFRTYAVTVAANQFVLRADGNVLFAGAMRDYPTTANPLTAVYGLSNYVFFGDDTARARAVVDLGSITVAAVPEPAPVALLLLAGGVLLARRGGADTRRR